MNPIKGGIRKPYGGTMSMGFKQGSLVNHKKYGIAYIGGTSNNRISIHDIKTGERLSQCINSKDCNFICYNSMRINYANNNVV
jgi:hypothetical protein